MMPSVGRASQVRLPGRREGPRWRPRGVGVLRGERWGAFAGGQRCPGREGDETWEGWCGRAVRNGYRAPVWALGEELTVRLESMLFVWASEGEGRDLVCGCARGASGVCFGSLAREGCGGRWWQWSGWQGLAFVFSNVYSFEDLLSAPCADSTGRSSSLHRLLPLPAPRRGAVSGDGGGGVLQARRGPSA